MKAKKFTRRKSEMIVIPDDRVFKYHKNCIICQKEFDTNREKQITCGIDCSMMATSINTRLKAQMKRKIIKEEKCGGKNVNRTQKNKY